MRDKEVETESWSQGRSERDERQTSRDRVVEPGT